MAKLGWPLARRYCSVSLFTASRSPSRILPLARLMSNSKTSAPLKTVSVTFAWKRFSGPHWLSTASMVCYTNTTQRSVLTSTSKHEFDGKLCDMQFLTEKYDGWSLMSIKSIVTAKSVTPCGSAMSVARTVMFHVRGSVSASSCEGSPWTRRVK